MSELELYKRIAELEREVKHAWERYEMANRMNALLLKEIEELNETRHRAV